jgi:hypothetical protein
MGHEPQELNYTGTYSIDELGKVLDCCFRYIYIRHLLLGEDFVDQETLKKARELISNPELRRYAQALVDDIDNLIIYKVRNYQQDKVDQIRSDAKYVDEILKSKSPFYLKDWGAYNIEQEFLSILKAKLFHVFQIDYTKEDQPE